MRHGHAQRAGVGRVDRQHLRREGCAREVPRLQGEHHPDRRDPCLPGARERQDRRCARGLAARRPVQAVRHQAEDGGPRRAERRRRPHRLVHPDVPDEAASRVQDVEGAEGQGVPLQEPRVGLAGDVPRRRPVLRAEGPAADQGARAELQVRERRRRAGAGRALEPAVQAAQAGDLLLVHAAVPEPGVPALRGGAAEAVQGLPRRREDRGRRREQYKCAYDKTITRRCSARSSRTAALPRRAPEVQLVERRPGDRREVDRGRPHEAGQGRQKWVNENAAKVKKWFGK